MIKEVIIVEGKKDIAKVKLAVDAECIATGGFSLLPYSLEKIRQAYEKRGLIILTDPDSAGEKIRRFLAKRFPDAKHAFISKEEAYANNDIGIEQAAPEAIWTALKKVRFHNLEPSGEFTREDIFSAGLDGTPNAALSRLKVGQELGIGYANAKTFLYRLNHYGVTRQDFDKAVKEKEIEDDKDGQH